MISLPGNQSWAVSQASDLYGHVVRTKAVDFNRKGYISLARKPLAIFTENSGVSATGDADFQDLFAITADTSYYYFFTIDNVFGATVSETAVTVSEISTSSKPTFTGVCDATAFNGEIVCTGDTSVATLTGFNGSAGSGTWTDKGITLDSSYPHPLAVFGNLVQLAVGGKNVVRTYNTSYSLQATLTLPVEYVVTSMRWRGNKLYIGTRTTNGTDAMLFVWNGSGTSAQAGHPVDADWIYSVCTYGSSVAVLTSRGQILRFEGEGFSELASLPVKYTRNSWSENATVGVVGKAINRGMWANGDLIYLNIQGEPRGLFAPGAYDQPGGLWCYDPAVGLYHKAGFTTEPYRRLSISTLASNIFTFGSAHGASTGDPVWAASVSNIPALVAGVVYYAIVESTTAIRLAASPADALAGRGLACSGTISGDILAFDSLDMTANTLGCIPGPVYGFNKNQFSPFFASEVLFGGSSVNPTGTTICSLMSLGMTRGVGSFVTARARGDITDIFRQVVLKMRQLQLDTESVIVKYRTSERFGLPTPVVTSSSGLATWVNASSFTVNTAGKDIRSAQIGDEVEIVKGAGAGYSGHISGLQNDTATWTITLDEDIPLISASDLSDIFVNNWTKLYPTLTNETPTLDRGFAELTVPSGIEGVGWIQFKVEMRGTSELAIDLLHFINELAASPT